VTWAVRLWPRDVWPYLPDGIAPRYDGALDLCAGPRHLAEAYLALVPVLAMVQPWGVEAAAGRAKLVMVEPPIVVDYN
jgi:hypothetical protein